MIIVGGCVLLCRGPSGRLQKETVRLALLEGGSQRVDHNTNGAHSFLEASRSETKILYIFGLYHINIINYALTYVLKSLKLYIVRIMQFILLFFFKK